MQVEFPRAYFAALLLPLFFVWPMLCDGCPSDRGTTLTQIVEESDEAPEDASRKHAADDEEQGAAKKTKGGTSSSSSSSGSSSGDEDGGDAGDAQGKEGQ
jgi:hypothetical protein